MNEFFSPKRLAVLSAVVLLEFTAVAGVLVGVSSRQLQDVDYMMIGCVATLVVLLSVFVIFWFSTGKSRDQFFRTRRRE